MGIETPRGQMIWRDRMVARVFEYAGERKPRPWAGRQTRQVRLSKRLDLATLFRDRIATKTYDLCTWPEILAE